MPLTYTADQFTRETQLLVSELALLADLIVGEDAGIRAIGVGGDNDFAQSRHPDDLNEVREMEIWTHVSRIERYVRDQEWHESIAAHIKALGIIVERTFSPAVLEEYELERAELVDILEPMAVGAGDVPLGFFHRGILADLVALAAARQRMDRGERLTMADIALLLDVREPTVVTNAHRKNFVSIEDGNRRYAEPADVLPWMIKQGYLPTRMPEQEPHADVPMATARDDDGFAFVPVARDGSWFGPVCRSGGRYTIGAKGEEVKFTDYFAALEALNKMHPPRWRRPNANGIPGIVTGVRFDRIRRSDIERALA